MSLRSSNIETLQQWPSQCHGCEAMPATLAERSGQGWPGRVRLGLELLQGWWTEVSGWAGVKQQELAEARSHQRFLKENVVVCSWLRLEANCCFQICRIILNNHVFYTRQKISNLRLQQYLLIKQKHFWWYRLIFSKSSNQLCDVFTDWGTNQGNWAWQTVQPAVRRITASLHVCISSKNWCLSLKRLPLPCCFPGWNVHVEDVVVFF